MTEVSRKSPLIPAQRRGLILELIRQSGIISMQDLSDALDVSLATIRRDLNWLAKTGQMPDGV
ncbi:MAG: DeoR family transcriptional regulator [Desulfobacterales bacterium]